VARTSVAEAAASPRWLSRAQYPMSGDVVSLQYNAALKRASDRARYPALLTVRVQATEHDKASYPVAADSPRFAELKARISELAEGHGVLAAAAASSTGWIFLLYIDAGSADWAGGFEAEIRSAMSDHLVGFNVTRDTKWATFARLAPRSSNPVVGKIVLYVVVPLLGAIPAASYSPRWAWAVGGALSILAWVVPLLVFSKKLLAAQLAHPAGAFAGLTYLFATLLFPVTVYLSHGAKVAITLGISVGASVVLMSAIWPAQQRYYARMRARAQLAPPSGTQLPEPRAPSAD
jgi:hypothetical protein